MAITQEPTELAQPPGSPAELAERIHAIDPAAFFVAGRVLRRVIVHDCLLTSLSIQAPHHPCYVIGHDALLDLVARDELSPWPRPIPETVMLLEAVEEEEFAARPHAQIYEQAQRRLLHVRVHAAYDKLVAQRKFLPTLVKKRIDEIGQMEFDEIRLVARQEDLVLPPRDERANFIEFAAIFLEQCYFDPAGLAVTFPALADEPHRVLDVLRQDLDLEACVAGLELARPLAGAIPAPDALNGPFMTALRDGQASADGQSESDPNSTTAEAPKLTARGIKRLIKRAERSASVGNNVRAAICFWRLHQTSGDVPQELVPSDARERAIANLETLCERLQRAIGFDDGEAKRWNVALRELLFATDQHLWPIEARLLYDLQKVCVDSEREIYTVDLTGWLAAWFNRVMLFIGRCLLKFGRVIWQTGVFLFGWVRDLFARGESADAEVAQDTAALNGHSVRPFRYPAIPRIRRSLPAQREVLMCKHLRSAEKRLAQARIQDTTRLELVHMLHDATHAAEHAMRDKLRRRLEGVLDRLRIRGENLAERVSRKKLVEELLDQIARRGFLTMGDLRDAIARNRAKLPDLSGFIEFFRGDPLLQANRRLTRSLDGVYRPAEVYLRWLQRLSSLAFANRVGRFLTRFVALPFGGAYVILAGLQGLVHEIPGNHGLTLTTPGLISLVGIVLLGLLNSQRLRGAVVRAQHLFRRGLALVFALLIDLLGLPVIRRILRSQGFRWFVRWLAKPLLVTVIVCLIVGLAGVSSGILGWVAAGTFVVANVALNTRSGRDLEEMTSEYVTRGWRNFRIVVLAGLVHWIIDWSKWVLNGIDRVLYSVDEWLRFRRGENRATIFIKAIVGSLWAIVRYFVRFCVNLLIEPQINPIKHFPVVTVGHKLLLVAMPSAAALVERALGYSYADALALVGSVIWLIPGIFGFMAWELKENWRLYRANQSRTVKPIIIGHHGETMLRMLKPGFHSGTIPKAFKKLRRARLKAVAKGNPAILRKAYEPLAEARHCLHDAVQRELIQLLRDCPAWEHEVEIGEIKLSTNQVEIELRCTAWPDQSAWISFADQSGRVIAGVLRPGWINHLEHGPRLILRNAILGFYKMCRVALVRQQLEACFPAHDFHYDINERGLALWPRSDFETEVIYEFNVGPLLHPTLVSGITPAALPTFSTEELFLAEAPLPWDQWVEYWDACTADHCPLRRMLAEFRILPAAKVHAQRAQAASVAPL